MRGADTFTESPFTLHRLEDFVPSDHPLRPIRQMVNAALVKMDGLFAAMYEAPSKGGRPSIAPEKLLRAMLLQVFYSIRSERQLMEQVAVQPAVPLVHRPGDGRCGVGAHGIYEKPRALAGP
ncbi:transposase [Polaromonas sp. CG_9.5]|nr:transposase [Polaromonas sp. CG_9.5]